MCGEKYNQAMEGYVTNGSPPRVRGKADGSAEKFVRGRITPACAGKRSSGLFAHLLTQDHPRVCGEKYKKKVNIN